MKIVDAGLAAAEGGAMPGWVFPVVIVVGVLAVGVAVLLWFGSRGPGDR